jgi:hypothetical protein
MNGMMSGTMFGEWTFFGSSSFLCLSGRLRPVAWCPL